MVALEQMVNLKMPCIAGALSSLGLERSFLEVWRSVAHLGTSVAPEKTGSGFFASTHMLCSRSGFHFSCMQADSFHTGDSVKTWMVSNGLIFP